MADSNSITATASQAESREYRLSRHTLHLGVFGMVVFGLAQIGSVAAALTNVDGSFKAPIPIAIFLAVGWSIPILLSYLLIVAYRRHLVLLTPEAIRIVTVLKMREVRFDDVTLVVWKLSLGGGRVALHSLTNKLKLDFLNYSLQERNELITFIRESIPRDCHEQGWEQYESRWKPITDYQAVRASMLRPVRFTMIAFGILIPAMYAILIWEKIYLSPEKHGWIFVVVFPPVVYVAVAGSCWFVSRGDLERTNERDPMNLMPKLRPKVTNQSQSSAVDTPRPRGYS